MQCNSGYVISRQSRPKTGMAFDSAGNLFVSEFAPTNPDTDDSVITEFTPGGVKSLFAAENGQRLNALAFAPEAPTETPKPGSLALTGASVLTGLGVFLVQCIASGGLKGDDFWLNITIAVRSGNLPAKGTHLPGCYTTWK